ncbi:homoserine O-acetyltransferase MetX [Sciscionella sediminilitoris]|uniref:homoserine O-acetyltransferase MetX n=1 Tax=Sciscionella sediminilitoris TaxID=1445613 RepID=UPI0004DEE1ED|nr:homoserine O-acetyltransferase [Sciscionella sp. SE31]
MSEVTISGGWREGDPTGRRKFFTARWGLLTESGAAFPEYTLAYETWGTLNPARDNAILIEHALTGDSHVAGAQGPGHPSPGWWDGLVGEGKAIDTRRYFVVAPNVLGGCQGSTGPATPRPDGWPWGGRFPALTVRDQVAAELELTEHLGITRWAAVIGGSMGGMRALEWAVMYPDRVAKLIPLATVAAASADQIAWSSTQIRTIEGDPRWNGGDYYHVEQGPTEGLGAARRMAQLSYRSALEFDDRFGRSFQDGEDPYNGGRFAIESYLDHHAGKLMHRFDAGSYVVLSRSMNGHDIGRARGGLERALGSISAETLAVGVSSDRLYPLEQQRQIAETVPKARPLLVLDSPHGHDGFLIETEQLAQPVAEFLSG